MFKLKGPLTVGWDITNMCNLRCKHCYASAGTRKSNEFTLEEVKKIIDELDSLGTVLIAFAGGEPFMRKDIYEIISYVKNKGMEVFLNTNGTLVNENNIKKILDSGLTHIEFSIDGLKEEHDFIRGAGTFDKVLHAIDVCQNNGIKVGVMSTLFKINLAKIPDFIDFFHDKGAIGIGFLRFIPTGRGEVNSELGLSIEERKRAIEYVYEKRMQYGEHFYLKIETPVSYLIAQNYSKIMEQHKYINTAERGCDGGITSCQILSDGTVTFCPQMNRGDYNLHDKTMEFIWENDSYFKKLRSRELKGKCGRCEHKHLCGGCRVDAFLKTGDILEEDSGCWLKC